MFMDFGAQERALAINSVNWLNDHGEEGFVKNTERG